MSRKVPTEKAEAQVRATRLFPSLRSILSPFFFLQELASGDLAERGEALSALESFRDQRTGKLDTMKIQEEIFIQTYIGQKRLKKGAEMMDRCPILKGEKNWSDVHSNPKKSKSMGDSGNDEIRMSSRTFLIIIAVIVIVTTGGLAVGWIGGWIP